MQIAVHAVLFLIESPARLQKESIARVLRDVKVRLVTIVVFRVLNQHGLEFLLINPTGLHSDLDKHLDDLLEIYPLNHLTITLFLDLRKKKADEPLLDLAVEYHLRLELTRLHRLHILVILHLWHKILVHVQ